MATENTQYIVWNDLNILQNLIGVWLMTGKLSRNKFVSLKLELNMESDSDNKWFKAVLSHYEINNGTKYENCRYGVGKWNLVYPTSLAIRPNIDFICYYYYRYYNIGWTILPQDVTNLIGDYVLGKGIGQINLIDLRLILDKSSVQFQKIDDEASTDNAVSTKNDYGNDFSEYFVLQIQFRIVDLLTYAIDKFEQEQNDEIDVQDIKIDDYNVIKLQQFVDESDVTCSIFQTYFE